MFFTPSPCANNWLPFTASVLPAPMSPAAKPLILLVAPSIFTSPTFTVSKLTSLAVATLYSMPPAALTPEVTSILSPATTVLCLAAVPATVLIASLMLFSPVPPMSLMLKLPSLPTAALPPNTVFTESATPYSWLPLTASVELAPTLPAATLVILLPAALIPVLVKLGPPVMVKPSVSSLLSPALMLSTTRFLFNAMPRPSEPAVVVMLLSPFTAKVSPSFFSSVVVLLSPVKVMPLLAISSDAVTPLVISALVLSDKSTA